jgi:hypothetical protein
MQTILITKPMQAIRIVNLANTTVLFKVRNKTNSNLSEVMASFIKSKTHQLCLRLFTGGRESLF